MTPNVISKNINKVIEIVESPLTSIRQIADYEIYKMASKKNKVILVGHGGDEIFAGYDQNIIRMIILIRRRRNMIIRRTRRRTLIRQTSRRRAKHTTKKTNDEHQQ